MVAVITGIRKSKEFPLGLKRRREKWEIILKREKSSKMWIPELCIWDIYKRPLSVSKSLHVSDLWAIISKHICSNYQTYDKHWWLSFVSIPMCQ